MISHPAAEPRRLSVDAEASERLPSATDSFPVVGVGASAGGLEALSQLLAHLPTKSGMAFILVQHLDPTHQSMLTEILARSSKMPVLEIANGMAVKPNYVY